MFICARTIRRCTVIGNSADEVVSTLKKALSRLYDWCVANQLTPHPGKKVKPCSSQEDKGIN